jgi:hypothetical protein
VIWAENGSARSLAKDHICRDVAAIRPTRQQTPSTHIIMAIVAAPAGDSVPCKNTYRYGYPSVAEDARTSSKFPRQEKCSQHCESESSVEQHANLDGSRYHFGRFLYFFGHVNTRIDTDESKDR